MYNNTTMIILKFLIKIKKLCNYAYGSLLTLFFNFWIKDHGKGLRVNSKCLIPRSTKLGNNCNFNGIRIEGGGVSIGNNFHSGRNILIITEFHNYEGDLIPYDNTFYYKKVVIADNVWIGHNVIICGNINIGEGAIIAAGAVVVKDVAPFSIVGGNPAKEIKKRNIEHYCDLKEKKKFN